MFNNTLKLISIIFILIAVILLPVTEYTPTITISLVAIQLFISSTFE